MQLTKCPVCQQQVSPRAKACPACGHPVNATPSGVQLFFAIVFLVAMAASVMQFAIPGGNAILAALLGIIAMQAAGQISKY